MSGVGSFYGFSLLEKVFLSVYITIMIAEVGHGDSTEKTCARKVAKKRG